uniref:Radical SAM protein n=1 Tax=Streptomyces auratus AGR0001 TaxID=1160718 RepID=J2K446_9ACTN
MRDAGVLWLQFTGGEPLIDRDFMDAYVLAYRYGMLIEILTNGSRLHRPEVNLDFPALGPGVTPTTSASSRETTSCTPT